MKRISALVPSTALILALVTPAAIAQTPPASATATRPAASPSVSPSQTTEPARSSDADRTRYAGMKDGDHWERSHRATRIIGTDVVNRQGDKIGDIEDIVLDSKGTIAYAVVSTGGFLGIGDRLHAVPWRSIQTNTGKDNFILDIDRDRLKSAPGFDKRNWPNLSDDKWSTENSRYFPRPLPTTGTPAK